MNDQPKHMKHVDLPDTKWSEHILTKDKLSCALSDLVDSILFIHDCRLWFVSSSISFPWLIITVSIITAGTRKKRLLFALVCPIPTAPDDTRNYHVDLLNV